MSKWLEWLRDNVPDGWTPVAQPIDNESIRRAQEQYFLHQHPEFKPVLQGDYERQMNSLGALVADLRKRVKALEDERK